MSEQKKILSQPQWNFLGSRLPAGTELLMKPRPQPANRNRAERLCGPEPGKHQCSCPFCNPKNAIKSWESADGLTLTQRRTSLRNLSSCCSDFTSQERRNPQNKGETVDVVFYSRSLDASALSVSCSCW